MLLIFLYCISPSAFLVSLHPLSLGATIHKRLNYFLNERRAARAHEICAVLVHAVHAAS